MAMITSVLLFELEKAKIRRDLHRLHRQARRTPVSARARQAVRWLALVVGTVLFGLLVAFVLMGE